MCRQITCRACNKTTWAGCGQHVQQVMANVSASDRCTCTDAQRAAGGNGSLLARLFGR